MRWADVVWSVGIDNPGSPAFVVLSVLPCRGDEGTGLADVEALYLDDLRRHTFRAMTTMWRSATVLRGRDVAQKEGA